MQICSPQYLFKNVHSRVTGNVQKIRIIQISNNSIIKITPGIFIQWDSIHMKMNEMQLQHNAIMDLTNMILRESSQTQKIEFI